MKDKLLRVSLPACRVGELAQERSGRILWRPDTLWEQGGQEPRLGLEFLRRPGLRSSANELPCWFENLLPERGSELRARLSAAHSLREGQSFELVRALGSDLIGAVETRPSDVVPESAELPSDPMEEQPTASDDPPPHMGALTGVQLKFSMSMVNDQLTLPARSGRTLWIVKIAGREYEGLASVESATMKWARLAGFTVPEHLEVAFDQLEGIPEGWVEGRAPAFAIRRFDRREDGSKVHQEDLCQALELRPTNKYGDREPRVTFEGALKAVTDACGDEDGREMARRIGFMIASGNTDAHLKNWSLVWGDRMRPVLSPCYDLVATISWERSLGWRRRGGPDLALRLGQERGFKKIDKAVLERFADGTRRGADEDVVEGIVRARNAWPAIAEEAPHRMRAALAEHWQSVPILAWMGPLGPSPDGRR